MYKLIATYCTDFPDRDREMEVHIPAEKYKEKFKHEPEKQKSPHYLVVTFIRGSFDTLIGWGSYEDKKMYHHVNTGYDDVQKIANNWIEKGER